jgi:very-short-patch-repair endonuclease
MLHVIASLVLVFVGFAVLRVLLKASIAANERRVQEQAYERAALFTEAERSFLGVLDHAVGGRYRVMGKVRLADVLNVKRGLAAGARQDAQNKISSKHVDFVLCDPRTLDVRVVVELDDKSHNRPNRRDRDQNVDAMLREAGIPILHFSARHAYSPQDIQNKLVELDLASATPPAPSLSSKS